MAHLIGKIYTNDDLNIQLGCSTEGGIRVAHKTKSIVLIHVPNSVYQDRPSSQDPAIFLFTGQGLEGNQQMKRNNLALRNSVDSGITLHFYVKEGSKQYRYKGVYSLVEEVFTEKQYDQNGDLRDVFVFPIRAV